MLLLLLLLFYVIAITFKLVVRLWMYQNHKHRNTLELLEMLVNEIEQTETTWLFYRQRVRV